MTWDLQTNSSLSCCYWHCTSQYKARTCSISHFSSRPTCLSSTKERPRSRSSWYFLNCSTCGSYYFVETFSSLHLHSFEDGYGSRQKQLLNFKCWISYLQIDSFGNTNSANCQIASLQNCSEHQTSEHHCAGELKSSNGGPRKSVAAVIRIYRHFRHQVNSMHHHKNY